MLQYRLAIQFYREPAIDHGEREEVPFIRRDGYVSARQHLSFVPHAEHQPYPTRVDRYVVSCSIFLAKVVCSNQQALFRTCIRACPPEAEAKPLVVQYHNWIPPAWLLGNYDKAIPIFLGYLGGEARVQPHAMVGEV